MQANNTTQRQGEVEGGNVDLKGDQEVLWGFLPQDI